MTLAKILCTALAVTVVFFAAPYSHGGNTAAIALFCNTPGSLARQEITTSISSEYSNKVIDCASYRPKPTDVFIALSYSDATAVLANPHSFSSPTIIANVYRDAVSDLLSSHQRENISVFFNDPDPLYQLGLAKAIFQDAPRLLLIHSYATHAIAAEYSNTAKSLGIELQLAPAQDERAVLRAIQSHSDTNAIVLIPDKRLYNRQTLANIINTSYRANIPLIGFSPALVKSGVLATVYPSVQLRANTIGYLMDHYSSDHKSPNIPLSEEAHSLTVNRRVAQSLGMTVAGELELTTSIKSQRKGGDIDDQ